METRHRTESQVKAALEFAKQAKRLGLSEPEEHEPDNVANNAVEAKFVTGQDPVIVTANGDRLPAVPVEEAIKLNNLKDQMQGRETSQHPPIEAATREAKDGTIHGAIPKTQDPPGDKSSESLRDTIPVYYTNPLFPPLPMYGPPTLFRNMQCLFLRVTSFIGSLSFLMVIVLGSAFTSIPLALRHIWLRLKLQDPDARRPFYEEEVRRKKRRREAERAWDSRLNSTTGLHRGSKAEEYVPEAATEKESQYLPVEGGPDPLICDAAYYARRVGLDMESFNVQTEDGFNIQLFHILDPRDHSLVDATTPQKPPHSSRNGLVESAKDWENLREQGENGKRRYPVLLMHGLLQSAGAFCCNDDDSLAFFLAKSGYDVWLGNNRCGFQPSHSMLGYQDPRMWAWNIRQMGVMDLSALVSSVLERTGFAKLGLVCHSQGTTQTFVALAKEQRPDVGERISVFCALAPAVYAGPLIKKFYFKIMRVVTPSLFRLIFGIHAFIPFMMTMHSVLPARLYGSMGYRVFSFLFDWTDDRWEQDIRDRFFQFSPTYVSAESMRWWLGRECFAKQKCILATRSEGQLEDEEDEEEDDYFERRPNAKRSVSGLSCKCTNHDHEEHGRYAWYDERVPPMAFWIAGNDNLVDGRRLLRRFDRGREPHVNLVHSKVIQEYEHLDVIWSMDAIEQVGTEVRDVIWETAPVSAKQICRVPTGYNMPQETSQQDDRNEFL